jgi:hypothetical protein
MELVPLFGALVIGSVGLILMVSAFVLVARQGGWQKAMQGADPGRWSLPRKLMFTGALLGVVFAVSICVLYLIPGGIPWLAQ